MREGGRESIGGRGEQKGEGPGRSRWRLRERDEVLAFGEAAAAVAQV